MEKTPRPIGHGRIYDSVLDTIGNTPLVRLPKLSLNRGARAHILAKLEFFNPMASVKDRIGLAMIDALEASGALKPGGTIIEPTSGNTGIALAFVAAARGYKIILCMPESMSIERRKMLLLMGATLELTPAEKGMRGAVARASELLAVTPNAVMPQQFENPANPDIHSRTTGLEIWNDTDGQVDMVISGVGTGGSITGIGHCLKSLKPSIKMVAVEPEASAILSGKEAGPHKIQGIGAGFIPDILDEAIIDHIETVTNDEALVMARLAAKTEGLCVGISSGAALEVAFRLASRPELDGKTVVLIIPSFAERYLSTALFDGF
jgi:cysteine synthase A